jgi:hypothetical protein
VVGRDLGVAPARVAQLGAQPLDLGGEPGDALAQRLDRLVVAQGKSPR